MANKGGKPLSAVNKEGDTTRVNRNIIALSWIKPEAERTAEIVNNEETGKLVKSGNILEVRANTFLYLPQSLIDWFAIPVFTGTVPNAGQTRRILVKAHQRTIITGALGATDPSTRILNINEFERQASVGKGGRRRKRVKVQLMGLSTVKGKPRFGIIPFPSMFNRHMISQALATMFASTADARKPMFFKPTDSTAVYRIPYGANNAGLMEDWLSGAWLATTSLIDEENISNPGGDISEGNLDAATSSGDADGPAET